jgi:D-sedoheptulose 7-phosphate isomerase
MPEMGDVARRGLRRSATADRESLVWAAARESILVAQQVVERQTGTLLDIADRLSGVLRRGGSIYLCGNGGSAADAQHVAAEFVGRFLRERRPLPPSP